MRQLFLNATLIDGQGGPVINKSGMLIDGERICAVGNAADFSEEINSGCAIHDCTGKTIMPGMINGHTHIFMEPYTWDRVAYLDEPLSSICLRIISNLKKTLLSGVTFIRDLGGAQDLDVQFKNYLQEKRVLGPGMICARHPLTITGGHCSDFGLACDGPAEFVKGVREQIRGGADLIKIMPTAGYARPKMTVNHSMMGDTVYMAEDEIKAAVTEAHKMGKIVAAHCYGTAGISLCVNNGVDTIEHGQIREPWSDDAKRLADEMAKKGVWQVPTMAAFFKEYDRKEVEDKYLAVIDSFRLYLKAGVKIAMGTDAGVPWVGHDKTAAELEHMVLYGMNNMEAIVTATKNTAEMLGIIDSYGTLESGKYADFLILDNDPLEDIRALTKGMKVVQHGIQVTE